MALRVDTLTSTVLGIAAGAAVLAFALTGGTGQAAGAYWNPHGLIIVLGGTLSATILSYRGGQLVTALRALTALFRDEPPIEPDLARLVEVARAYQRHDITQAEQLTATIPNPFLRLGLQLALDNSPVEDIQHMMSWRIDRLVEKETSESKLFRTMAEFAPAFGLLATLVGLVGMMAELGSGDVGLVGQKMAVGMIGTVYGVIFSNLVFKPVASKLEQRMLLRVAMMNVLLDGVLQMRLGRNAGTIEDALQTLVRTHTDEIRGRAA
jgi:chemotaxis protein MotA